MGIPSNSFTAKPLVTEFLPPADEPYNPLIEAVFGGIALGDNSQGRDVQRWTVFYTEDDGTINIADEAGEIHFTMAVPDVQTVSIGFDTNMRQAIAYQTPAGTHFYYYNSDTNAYDTMVLGDGTSCRAATDDPRSIDQARSDVIFAYVRDGVLYYRVQREKYLTERTVGPALAGPLIRVALNKGYRLQFKLASNP